MFEKKVFLKKFRLLRKYQYQLTLRDRGSQSSAQFVQSSPLSLVKRFFVLHQRTNQLDYPRLGIITTKKKFPTAVMRNLLKRQVRETFRRHRSFLGGYDFVILARIEAAQATRIEIRQCLNELFSEFGLQNKGG